MNKSKDKTQGWNDNFQSFMEQPVSRQPVPQQKQDTKEDVKQEGEGEGEEKKEKVENEFVDDKRLFVENLSYQVTKEEL